MIAFQQDDPYILEKKDISGLQNGKRLGDLYLEDAEEPFVIASFLS